MKRREFLKVLGVGVGTAAVVVTPLAEVSVLKPETEGGTHTVELMDEFGHKNSVRTDGDIKVTIAYRTLTLEAQQRICEALGLSIPTTKTSGNDRNSKSFIRKTNLGRRTFSDEPIPYGLLENRSAKRRRTT